jgi:hypothetical protein
MCHIHCFLIDEKTYIVAQTRDGGIAICPAKE